ncbi:MAG: sodium ion-translocating decarboxylase subunit beta, partial [Desulfurococcales archaeon]|nr:sodium ion-translocating decarboxylase subunit beta [Desulfurococcales archaeon]
MSEVVSELVRFITAIVGILSLPPAEIAVRVVLAIAGAVVVYLGYKRYLEPLIMIPMGLGMIIANLAFIPGAGPGSGNPHVNY